MAGDLPSFTRIEADNRGLVVMTATADVDTGSLSRRALRVTTAGTDGLFGTGDDQTVRRTVRFDSASRQLIIQARVEANVNYKIRLDGSSVRTTDGRQFDAEFRGSSTISGDGTSGGVMEFFTTSAAEDIVRFTSVAGVIDVRMFTDRTPRTVENFLRYADRGVWDQTFIHRSVSGFVVQGGGFSSTSGFRRIPQDPAVVNEPGISNIRGTISMAKLSGNPNSATNEWFFNLGNNSSNLDNQNGGFTAFGEVIGSEGLSVMDALAAFRLVNASAIQSAFNELPVVDQTAVLARPMLQIETSDLVRFTRIALMVGVEGSPGQQFSSRESAVIAGPAGDTGPQVRVIDVDRGGGRGLESAVRVTFSGDAISNITITRDFPEARLGLVITGASRVGSITDLRTSSSSGELAFIASSAPVGSVRLNRPLTGADVNGFLFPGLRLANDIDGDGNRSDRLALYIESGLTQSLVLTGGVTGDVVIPGGLVSATVGGVADQADFDIGAARPEVVSSYAFERVVDSEIRSDGPIGQIRATEWLDVDQRAEQIVAPRLDALSITGSRSAGLAGDFEAGIRLTAPPDAQRFTLGSALVAGTLSGSAWNVSGRVGPLNFGLVNGWTLSGPTEVASLVAQGVSNSTVTVSRRVGDVSVRSWFGGSLSAGTLGTLVTRGDTRAGDSGNFEANLTVNGAGAPASRVTVSGISIAGSLVGSTTTINGNVGNVVVRGDIERSTFRVNSGEVTGLTTRIVRNSTLNLASVRALSTVSLEDATLQGGTYTAVTVSGDARAGVAGDAIINSSVTLLRSLAIAGDLRGQISGRSIGTLTVGGSAIGVSINLTQTPDVNNPAITRMVVAGRFEGSELRSSGIVRFVEIGRMVDSGIYVGVDSRFVGLPLRRPDFRNGALLEILRIGRGSVGEPGFVNSFVVGTRFNSLTIVEPQTDNFGRVFGVAARTVTELRTQSSGRTILVRNGSADPAPIGDYVVLLNLPTSV